MGRAVRFLLTAMAFALLSCSGARAQLDTAPRIAVISAFAPEWKLFQEDLEGRQDFSVNGVTFATGKLSGQDVVLLLSGISMVNAAMTTQLALDHFNVTAIVVSGIAGGVDPARSIGDVVVAEEWGEYLETFFARETNGGFTAPPDAKFPNFGMMFPQSVEVMREGLAEPEERFWFPADSGLLDIARRVVGKVELEQCVIDTACMTTAPSLVVGGRGVSGSAFVDNAAFRDYTFKTFGAQVLDMETAAVAHVAYANGVPFVAFRSLSDLAGGGAGENEIDLFFQLAADNSARVVRAFLAELP